MNWIELIWVIWQIFLRHYVYLYSFRLSKAKYRFSKDKGGCCHFCIYIYIFFDFNPLTKKSWLLGLVCSLHIPSCPCTYIEMGKRNSTCHTVLNCPVYVHAEWYLRMYRDSENDKGITGWRQFSYGFQLSAVVFGECSLWIKRFFSFS